MDEGLIMAQKLSTSRIAEVRLRLAEVLVVSLPAGCEATVTLRLGARKGTGYASSRAHGPGEQFVVAEATLAAITATIGKEYTYILKELIEVPSETDKVIVTVLTNESSSSRRLVGGARAADSRHAVSKAILDALNRVLARTLAEILLHDASMGARR